MNGSALERSVGGDDSGGLPCRQIRNSVWGCAALDPSLFNLASYRVTVDSLGCWTATLIDEAGRLEPTAQLSGCVTILDYISG
jgi:hypothetical protein